MQPFVSLYSVISEIKYQKVWRTKEGNFSLSEKFVQELTAGELIGKYSQMIYRLAYSRLQNVSDAEDITQDVLLKLVRSDKTFKDEEHRKAWLLKVAVNTIKTFATSAYRRHSAPFEEAGNVTYKDNESSGVEDAVKRLPEKYRIVIHLFYYEDIPINKIAKIIGKSEGTVKSQLSRGRDKLKEILTGGGYYVG